MKIAQFVALAALLITATGTLFFNLAKANPTWDPDFPREPDLNPPTIILHSPIQNQTFSSTNIPLNFTVAKPETWFKKNSNLWVLGKITSVSYEVDGGEKQSLPVQDTATYNVTTFTYPPQNLNFSLSLTLPEGTHKITVRAEAESYYVTPGYLIGAPLYITVHGEPKLVNFTVAQPESETPEPQPESEPFPVVPVAAASVASAGIITVGLLAYFKKRKQR
jgi:hypothetical protein